MFAFNPLNQQAAEYPKRAVEITFSIHDHAVTVQKNKIVDRKELIMRLNDWKRYTNASGKMCQVDVKQDWMAVCDGLIAHLQMGQPARELFLIADENEIQGIAMGYQNNGAEYLITGLLTAPWNLFSGAQSIWNIGRFFAQEHHVQYKNIGSALISAIIDDVSTHVELKQVVVYAGTSSTSAVGEYYKNRRFVESNIDQKWVLQKQNFKSFKEEFGSPRYQQKNAVSQNLF